MGFQLPGKNRAITQEAARDETRVERMRQASRSKQQPKRTVTKEAPKDLWQRIGQTFENALLSPIRCEAKKEDARMQLRQTGNSIKQFGQSAGDAVRGAVASAGHGLQGVFNSVSNAGGNARRA